LERGREDRRKLVVVDAVFRAGSRLAGWESRVFGREGSIDMGSGWSNFRVRAIRASGRVRASRRPGEDSAARWERGNDEHRC
jgi:hypothetical protein